MHASSRKGKAMACRIAVSFAAVATGISCIATDASATCKLKAKKDIIVILDAGHTDKNYGRIRVCRHSSERYASGGAMDGGGEARIGFIVTGSDAPKLLEPLEAVLDEMPPFVHLKIMWEGSFPVSLGGNDGDCTTFVQCGAQAVAVKPIFYSWSGLT